MDKKKKLIWTRWHADSHASILSRLSRFDDDVRIILKCVNKKKSSHPTKYKAVYKINKTSTLTLSI